MTRINRIVRLRDCGIFRDFQWPSDLPEFGRYNVIYGWNGTGKTTISRVLRDLELRRQPPNGTVLLKIDGREVRTEDFPHSTSLIRVFNRDLIEDSIFRKDGGKIPPIFIFGRESVEKQKEIERLKNECSTAQAKLEDARNSKEQAERDFNKFCIDQARVIKDTLRSSGKNPYNNYDRSNYRKDASEMAKAGDASSHQLNEDEHENLLAQYHSTPKPKVEEVTYSIPDLNEALKTVSDLLRATVVSAAIQSLRQDPELSEWVRHGLELHRDRKAARCLFCDQPLPNARVSALEAHFNAEYEKFMQRLEELIAMLQSESEKASKLQLPNKVQLYDDLAADYESAKANVIRILEATQVFLENALQALEDKKQRPFERLETTIQLPQIDAEAIEKLNALIRKHNQACEAFDERVKEARRRLANGMIADSLEEFLSHKDRLAKAEENVKTYEQNVNQLNNAILRLEREIIEHRRPAEELNEDLRKYLGHDELRMQVQDTGYVIMRGRVPAQDLSEGEMTAIALLYFLKSLQDRRFALNKGVVVLDDPVSSLDANALYLAFGFIRERTQDVGQLIILTHNFRFFRQVRNWLHNLRGQKKKDVIQRPARFYMLECAHHYSGRFATIRWLDPLLEKYDSEYHYLFARVYRASIDTRPMCLEYNYALPNIARRMLEAFLAFRYPHVAGGLWQKVEKVAFDGAKKLRILRFLHTHSHSSAVEEPEHDLSVLNEARSVLRDLLELIETEDKGHYDAMVELITSQASERENQ